MAPLSVVAPELVGGGDLTPGEPWVQRPRHEAQTVSRTDLRRTAVSLSLLGLALALAGCAPDTETGRTTTGSVVPFASVRSVVTRIVDGDTLHVSDLDERVRLIGIDTPEVDGDTECYGNEATDHLAGLVQPGTEVEIRFDVEKFDRYGRYLGYVYRLSDDLFVNERMLSDGYAQIATFPPNVMHVDDFNRAQTDAREAGRGPWAVCDG